jgi:hypothetical protein
VLSVIERMRPVTTKPLARAECRDPAVEDGRLSDVAGSTLASFTWKLVKAGASIVGGCCGTTPTRAMKSSLRAMDADEGGIRDGERQNNQTATKQRAVNRPNWRTARRSGRRPPPAGSSPRSDRSAQRESTAARNSMVRHTVWESTSTCPTPREPAHG